MLFPSATRVHVDKILQAFSHEEALRNEFAASSESSDSSSDSDDSSSSDEEKWYSIKMYII